MARELSDAEVFGAVKKPGELSDEDVFGAPEPQQQAAPERPWFRPATPKPVSDAVTGAIGLKGMPQRVASEAISPAAEYLPRQMAAARGGMDMMSQGFGNIGAMESPLGVAQGVGQVGLGALGYLGSPITAAYQGITEPATNLVGQPIEKVTEGVIPAEATGAALTALAPGAGLTRLPGGRMTPTQRLAQPPVRPSAISAPKQAPVMSTQELRGMGNAAFKEAEDAGVVYTPKGVTRLSKDVQDAAADFGFNELNEPAIGGVIKQLEAGSAGNMTLEGLDSIRKALVNTVRNSVKTNPSQAELGRRLIEKIDDFIDSPKAADVLIGDAGAGASAFRRARATWKQMRKSEMVDEALERAAMNSEGAGSGGNIDNATRQQFKAILQDKKKIAPFTAEERALMRNIVRGGGPISSKAQYVLRLAGKLSPQGNGLMLWGSIAGASIGGPMVAGLPVAGFVAKRAADAMTKANAARLATKVREVPQQQFQMPQDFLPPPRGGNPPIPPGGGLMPQGTNVIPLRGRTY